MIRWIPKMTPRKGIRGKNMGKLIVPIDLEDLNRSYGNRFVCPVCKKGTMEMGSRTCSCGLCGQSFVIKEKE